jgi:HK97 gp10 family phage protein
MPFELTMKVHSQMGDATEAGIRKVIDETARAIVDSMKASMRESKSGRLYRRKFKNFAGSVPHFAAVKTTSFLHQASAPGESPAVDTADLWRSIGVTDSGDLSRTISVTVPYARALEFGSAKFGPRPYMGPAFERFKTKFREDLRNVFARTT